MGTITLVTDGLPWNRQLYEWKSGSVTVAGVTPNTNLNTITGFTTLFQTVKEAHHITISCTGTCYICLDKTTNDIITVTSTTTFKSDFRANEAIFIATGGSAVTVTVILE